VGTGGRRVGNLEGRRRRRRRSLGCFFISFHKLSLHSSLDSLYGFVSGMELSEKNPGGVKTHKNP
jgi:hypothetical protein